MKREAELKSLFTKEMKRQLPNFFMLHFASAGAPDREIVGNGFTTRWEFKHGTPGFASPGNQELFCMRLAAAGHCRYVIWQESRLGLGARTMIVHPKNVYNRGGGWNFLPEASCPGFDIRWLVNQVREAHRA